ncbi:hypothetical protein IQ06DRAFT_295900 [Phaeosphaeriaceae sp. SRC1lsM3a]|nr:hypothetical protein IQ06DRAFT_295900 [Stagonospora sp. SRC1lsM3a]
MKKKWHTSASLFVSPAANVLIVLNKASLYLALFIPISDNRGYAYHMQLNGAIQRYKGDVLLPAWGI